MTKWRLNCERILHWSEDHNFSIESVLIWPQEDAVRSAKVTAIFVATMTASPITVRLLTLAWRHHLAAFLRAVFSDFLARFLSDVSAGMFSHVVSDDSCLDGAIAAVAAVVDRNHVLVDVVEGHRCSDVVYVVNLVFSWVHVVHDVVALARASVTAAVVMNVDVDVRGRVMAAVSAALIAAIPAAILAGPSLAV